MQNAHDFTFNIKAHYCKKKGKLKGESAVKGLTPTMICSSYINS